jgi:hypothetical protein
MGGREATLVEWSGRALPARGHLRGLTVGGLKERKKINDIVVEGIELALGKRGRGN